MSTEINDRITASLHRQAEQIDVTRPLVAGAYRQARRQRTSRLITAVAGAAAIAVGVPIALNLGGSDRDQTADVPQVTFDLGELPRGDPPAVPWSQEGVIYDGDREIPGGREASGRLYFVPVADGYLVNGASIIGTDGEPKDPLPEAAVLRGPKVSADGTTLAWTATAAGGGAARLTTADARSGEVQHETTTAQWGDVVGFLGERVVLSDHDDQTRIWHPETGEVSRLEGVTSARSTNGRNLLAILGEDESGERCLTVLDANRDFAPAWKRCRFLGVGSSQPAVSVFQFTRDGRYALLLHSNKNDGDSGNVGDEGYTSYLVDANTGEELLHFRDVPLTLRPTVEPAGDLLFEVFDVEQDQQGIVRCSLDGDCELATELKPVSDEVGPWLPNWWGTS